MTTIPPHGDFTQSQSVVRAGSPASLLALVPQLLGFQPHESVVIVGAQPPRGRVRLTLRFDLPPTENPQVADEVAQHLISTLVAQDITFGVAVGYGPADRVTSVADALRAHAAELGFHLTDVLRAEGGRYWSYLCTDPSCCSPEGVPYDVTSHSVTSAFAAAGAPSVLASREELAATVAPLNGEPAEAMAQATRLASDQAARLVEQARQSGGKGAGRRLIASAGLDAVREAIDLYRAGGEFRTDLDAAWLSVVLRELRVRDDAWARMDPEYLAAHRRLWTDLTRRARPGYVAAPASLLAFVAWQSGNGALANVALDRAQADDPRYSMASLLREAIASGAPPRLARLPMTPEEVAASYAGAEAKTDDDAEFDATFRDDNPEDEDSGDNDDADPCEGGDCCNEECHQGDPGQPPERAVFYRCERTTF